MQTIFIVLCGVLVVSCNGIKDALKKDTPYEEYKELLLRTKLHETAMGKQWLEAGNKALNDSVFIELPHAESGFFKADNPAAHAYRFEVMAGQQLEVEIYPTLQEKGKLFIDLFQWEKDKWAYVAHADTTYSLSVEFKDKAQCVLRIQPELLTNAYYVINLKIYPQLINPVLGASDLSIGSFYGAPRDGGRRKHEGIDIFANRGTPVIAPTGGRISRVGVSRLGGNVVWLRDTKRGLLFYFAHLEEQLVNVAEQVSAGDTIGLVGNSGNAQYTTPHLHFGVYNRGALDPLGFVQQIDNSLPDLKADPAVLGYPYRVTRRSINLRAGPGIKYYIKAQLSAGSFLSVVGETDKWYRVQRPDGRAGYVHRMLIEKISSGTPKKIHTNIAVLAQPKQKSPPIANVSAPNEVEVLADYENFQFIRTENGLLGWISAQTLR
ncbi:peptidase M23B [Fulvivirga imtechensis AK7]|uniref:Peptidase M23B n=1 Tax=Fulvivirga imtechensis AK7 TaxID=1237149 RepID=L8JZ20_9BACT|nr:peptidoglycan DD-metalloendopeptidase family protein [Fulvivirga imtechensis]ELR72437.1 peptidase M23B [Fulvivirga imtechensis AK7]